MLTFLINRFIKDSENVSSTAVRQSYGIMAGILGIAFNMFLFFCKLFAGLASNSIAIMADAFNNLSDAGSSIITLIGFRMAGQKPDPDHPFGHGRIEYLSGLIVSLAILVMAIELITTSFEKVLHPEPITFHNITILILVISIFMKLYMSYYNLNISKKIHSTAMKATAIDSLSDALATSVVLISTFIARFTEVSIDGYCGILVGLFILFAGFNAVKETISPLLGNPPSAELVQSIEKIVLSYTDVLGIHDLIVHDYGPGRLMISLHAEVPSTGNLLVLHDTIDLIEHRLRADLSCNAVIHLDPIAIDDTETILLKQQVINIIHTIDSTLSLHDFRIVKGPTHTNIIFDLLIPYEFAIPNNELKQLIDTAVKELDSTYFTKIEFDHAYC